MKKRGGYMPSFNNLKNTDKEIYDAIEKELQRERNKIELIASENFVSESVMEANRKLYDKQICRRISCT